jgi:paired amphipathic helix protein Sin3a
VPQKRAPKREKPVIPNSVAGDRGGEDSGSASPPERKRTRNPNVGDRERVSSQNSNNVNANSGNSTNYNRDGLQDNAEGTKEDRKFLDDVYAALNNTQIYQDFCKALGLFNKQLVSRSAILEYAKDLFENLPDLMERFRRYCNAQAGIRPPRVVAVPHFTEMDFGSLQRFGVSYRALPKMYRKGVCSGRSALDQTVLNDTWVSVPTGREDEQVTFRGSLKNQYEEVLFQCEDDRYELDLVVELNAATLRFLEPIRAKLSEMTDAELRTFKLREPLEVLHQRSIERLYGAEGDFSFLLLLFIFFFLKFFLYNRNCND